MTETTPSGRILGTLRRTDETRGALRMEDVYDTDIDDLWSAITEPARLARWLAQVDGSDLRVGGTVNAVFTSSWAGPVRIEVCERPSRLLVTLSADTEDETEIEAWLTPEGDRTRFVVEERGLPIGELSGHGAGWQAHVEDLANYLTGCGDGDWRSRWTALIPAYEAIAPA